MIKKQHLRAVFLYMCEAERCPASMRDREPGSWNFSSGDEKNIPDHNNAVTRVREANVRIRKVLRGAREHAG